MKARPRGVEVKVAKTLSVMFEKIGADPVKRIPVLGREGPDITSNEINLSIDVKSRKTCPKKYMHGASTVVIHGDHVAFRIGELLNLDKCATRQDKFVSKQAADWLAHMAKHSEEGSLPAIVLHRPRLTVAHSIMVLSKDHFGILKELLNDRNSNS